MISYRFKFCIHGKGWEHFTEDCWLPWQPNSPLGQEERTARPMSVGRRLSVIKPSLTTFISETWKPQGYVQEGCLTVNRRPKQIWCDRLSRRTHIPVFPVTAPPFGWLQKKKARGVQLAYHPPENYDLENGTWSFKQTHQNLPLHVMAFLQRRGVERGHDYCPKYKWFWMCSFWGSTFMGIC